MPPLLAIETSGKSLGVALRSDAGLLFSENVTAGSIHGKALAPLIDKALTTHGLKPGELEAVAVSLGPGSWTGLRIGLSAAKALAWGAQIGIVGVPSFEALARDAAARAPEHARLTVRDGRNGWQFCALFAETSAAPERWIAEGVLEHAELLIKVDGALAVHPGIPVALCGDEVSLQALEKDAAQRNWTVLHGCEHISAAALAECGWERLLRGEVQRTAAEIHKVAPLYLRASGPELKLALRGPGVPPGLPELKK
jgi:tRNA threonylcarbamoyl adenosine modification protein YeaZ